MPPLMGGSMPSDTRESSEPTEEALRCGAEAAEPGELRDCTGRGGGPPVTAFAAATAVAAALSSLLLWTCGSAAHAQTLAAGFRPNIRRQLTHHERSGLLQSPLVDTRQTFELRCRHAVQV